MTADTTSNPPLVGIVTLNWNSYAETAACLASLADIEYPSYEVYVADNGSDDGSIQHLESEFEWCHFIRNNRNLGFAAGNNPAIEQALADGADYVLLLNNDTVVESTFLVHLVETAERNPDAAIVGGVVLDEDGEVWSAGGIFRGTFTTLSHETDPPDRTYETSFVSGALMLLRREFLESVGLLNEAYFFGMEDEELAWKARRRGWRLLVNPRARVTHRVGASSSEGSPFRYYHDVRNRLAFASENLSLPRMLVFVVFFVCSRLVRFAQWGVAGHTDRLRAALSGIVDHLLRRPHRAPEEFE